jgi:hypothetical protein
MKCKGAGIIPVFAIFCFFSSSLAQKLVEVSVPIIKVRFLPSASSETRGFVRKGQRFVIDGESGQWYRIRFFNAAVWIPKDAVQVLESSEQPPADEPPQPAQAQPAAPPQQSTDSQRVTRLRQALPQVSRTTAPPASSATVAAAEKAPETIAVQPPPKPVETAPPKPTPAAHAAPPAPVRAAPAKPKKPETPAPPRTWFPQFSRIPQVTTGEAGKEVRYFQITRSAASVYSSPQENAAVLMRANRNDFFPLIEEQASWCKVALQDTAGWIPADKGAVVAAPKTVFIDEVLVIIIVAALLMVLALAVVLTLLLRRKAKTKTAREEQFHALIIARHPPLLKCVISSKTLSLEKYLNVIGFVVKSVYEPAAAQKMIDHRLPDVVFIDWNMSDDLPGTVEILFAGIESKRLPLAVFFNVPDLSDIPMIPVLLRAYHLGSSFSDHDISKLITPTMLSKTSPLSGAVSALEGDIAEGNLPEIMQFIEIGKKTGCLLIEGETPLGMIYFGQGRIIHAVAANSVSGRNAINALLGLKEGRFKFLLGKQPKVCDLSLSTLEVLMEWTKTVDEAHRD